VLIQGSDEATRDEADEQQGQAVGRREVPQPRSPSAARLLEMTARDTDQWRSDARAEAAEIVAAAREEADELVRSAQREAEGMVEAARLAAARTVDEAQATADDVLTETEKQRAHATAEVARLEQLAADSSDLNDMLDRLDSGS
jgi:cell division septum initiation protein DivIVA